MIYLLVSERLTSIHISLLRCHCGNYELTNLLNTSQCYCCCELDGCMEALVSDIVLQDLPEGTKLTCITGHPGLQAVCYKLVNYSLKLLNLFIDLSKKNPNSSQLHCWKIYTSNLIIT